jgi:hypothetical protein
MFAGIGSMQALVPPQMMLIDAVGAIAILQLKRSMTPMSAASGQAPRSLRQHHRRLIGLRAICLKIFMFHDLAIARFEAEAARLQEAVEAHYTQPDRAFARERYIWRAPFRRGRGR